MEFKTAYNTMSKNAASTPSGEKIIKEHREQIDTKGHRELIKDREVAIYDRIQSSAEQCEITNILRRAAEGDDRALNMVNGNYMDIVDAPTSLAEAQKFVINAKNEFEKLPKEIKAKFENNAEMYVANYGTELWQDAVGITAAKEAEKHQKEMEKQYKELQKKAAEKILEKGSVTNE